MKFHTIFCYKSSSVLYLLASSISGLLRGYAGEEFLAAQVCPASSHIEKQKTAKDIGFLSIEYHCHYQGKPIDLKSLSVIVSNGQEFETPSLSKGNKWPFTQYGKSLNPARIDLAGIVFPLTLRLRWLTNKALLSEMPKHYATHLTTLPLSAWTTWEELDTPFIIKKEDLFTPTGTQKVFKIIISSPTHGAADTSLIFS